MKALSSRFLRSPLAKQKYILSLSTKKFAKSNPKDQNGKSSQDNLQLTVELGSEEGACYENPRTDFTSIRKLPLSLPSPRSGGPTTRGCLKSSLVGQAIRPVACLKSSWPIWIPYLESSWSSGLSL
jgi:hypothetical protein